MSMRKKLALNWQGESFPLLVDMECIDRVDEQMSVGIVLSRQLSGDIRFSHVAKFISIILNEAGASTTQENVYEHMFSNGGVTMVETTTMLTYILSAFFPEPKKKDTITKPTKQTRKRNSCLPLGAALPIISRGV